MSNSTDYMTSQFLRTRIRRSWRASGLIEGRSGRPGLSITEIVRLSRKRNRSIKIEPLELWLIIYDEYLSWYVSFFTVIQQGLHIAKADTFERDLLRCFLAVTSKVISDLFAIRHLCVEGFDVATKTLLRSTIEYIDILSIVAIEPSICREFVDIESNEESNAFWNKYLRGGKKRNRARHIMRKAWVELGVFEDYQMAVDFDKWLYEESDVLAMSSHPSFLGGSFSSIVLGSKIEDNWPGVFGSKGEISAQTLHVAVKHTVKFLFLSGDIPFRDSEKEVVLMEYQETDQLHRHTKIGRSWLISFYVAVIADPRGKPIFFPEIDVSDIWPDLKDGQSSD